jgi:hypothetical protein
LLVSSGHIQDSTLGGKMATAMGELGGNSNAGGTPGSGKDNGNPSFDGNSIGAGKEEPMPLTGIEEIDNFVNKHI